MNLSERPFARTAAPSATFAIFVAGDPARAREICRAACDGGLCVTIREVDFIYTGGEERGVEVGLINYPRFPKSEAQIADLAESLALDLVRGLRQTSASIVGPRETVFLSRRGE